MQDDQHAPAKPQLEFKEVAVLIPLIGTAIAISYDVGYFYGLDIKLFTLFSITEHVVFALEATPVAFVLAIFLIAYLGPGLDVLLGVKVHTAGKNMHKTKRRYVDAAIPAGLVLLVGVALYFSFFGLIAGLIAGAAVTLFRLFPIPRRLVYLISGILIIVTAFATGHDFAHSYVSRGASDHSIQLENEKLAVKLIRAGDRGVLYFEPKTKQLDFVRWDAVRKLSSAW
ncbi:MULTISPECIES: hypothetical protein [unclassified Bradyrhizobium]|uniref:hypothetical protein n=1 Tax=unclassified Bradyrhizobium TaxID=2631580 RepID=UPI0023043D22|nr:MULTISPECIES: hypothetical protein [unclassified Bradyrhizobium]